MWPLSLLADTFPSPSSYPGGRSSANDSISRCSTLWLGDAEVLASGPHPILPWSAVQRLHPDRHPWECTGCIVWRCVEHHLYCSVGCSSCSESDHRVLQCWQRHHLHLHRLHSDGPLLARTSRTAGLHHDRRLLHSQGRDAWYNRPIPRHDFFHEWDVHVEERASTPSAAI